MTEDTDEDRLDDLDHELERGRRGDLERQLDELVDES
jgi:hypothetical protein